MDPIGLSTEIEERYRRYLKTTFYFRDPDLRASFEEALKSGRLSKGPYLEATPVFKRGQTPRALFRSLLGYEPDEGFLTAVHGDRPLYWHQEEAIRNVFRGENVIVATGTGSGKTEAFLYPILLHLYQEFQAGTLCPGVRALVLYPMNALANDQRERLGEICKQLEEMNSPFRFTFGQYIGETPDDENDSQRHAQDHIRRCQPGELVLRSEMRTAPPHILLTNYSMLEYLLLRPDDSPLFDNGQARWWTFLVLDEAHQYRGSRGIEMAMLLRRLKQRLREGGRTGSFRCIATSATVMGEEGDRQVVAQFASDLFGETFTAQAVILGKTEPVPVPGQNSFQPDDYKLLHEALREQRAEATAHLAELASRVDVSIPDGEEIEKSVGRLLQQDDRSSRLQRMATGQPIEVQQIADDIFGDLPAMDRAPALAGLVALLVHATDPVSGAPLLSARYHLFLRSLEGAFVSYWPKKKVFLDRKAVDEEMAAFEVALCRECGQHYFVGRIENNKWMEAIRDPSLDEFGTTFLRPIEGPMDEDESDEDSSTDKKQEYTLCLRCGEIRRTGHSLQCGHADQQRVIKEDPPSDEDRKDQIARCGACGYMAAGRDPVREIIYGADGPHAVIATTLYQQLPPERRKVLAFADGRQEAAFFAWYLEDSYKDILSRNVFLKIARSFTPYPAAGISLSTIADKAFHSYCQAFKTRESDDEPTIRKQIWRTLYRELLTEEQRISLEGVGLVRWSITWPTWFPIPDVLLSPPWSLSETEARDLLFVLVDSMRVDKAIELRTGNANVALSWSDLGLQASQMRFRIGVPRGSKGVRSWDGERGRRAKYLAKLLMKARGLSNEEALKEAVATLRELWDSFRECEENAPSSDQRLLLSVDDARRLNPDWWRLHPLTGTDTVFQCDTCGRLQAVSVRDVCPRSHCPGTLKGVRWGDLEPNHYRLLYEEGLPGMLRVEEHTAQLDKEKAREFQREFREGKIHILSCSTTFELGVDLGDLDTIFLRNVPPETFNYAQRVGRAGRRPGYPGFAVTYCRRSPHDLYHFSDPERMLAGKIRPPTLSLRNEKIITRHITATALSAFFREDREGFKSVQSLFQDLTNPSGVTDFTAYLRRHQHDLESTLRCIVPSEMFNQVGLSDGQWIEKVAGEESRFALAEAEVSSDYTNVVQLEKQASQAGDYKRADWARGRRNTIADEDVLSFLSRKAVIPKYGFPVDVVELDTQRIQNQEASEVLLQRDLRIAISEFAPTSELVANKKVWTSSGLKKVMEKEWPRRRYTRCDRHNLFLYWDEGQPEPSLPCGDSPQLQGTYVIPQFGFVTNGDKPKEPRSRTARVFTTRPYFAGPVPGIPDPDTVTLPSESRLIDVRKASPGVMVVLCEGRRGGGFYVCARCGAGFKKREKAHKSPYGKDCKEKLERVSLGHEFVTDVLQLQFQPKPDGRESVWFAYSLAYALVEGAAEILEVPSTDLNGTVAYSETDAVPLIILYDDVPGGAGLVARLEEEKTLRAALEAALKRVSGNCGCAESTSCYGCLRGYRNQFAHQHLQRGPVMRYLQGLLSQW